MRAASIRLMDDIHAAFIRGRHLYQEIRYTGGGAGPPFVNFEGFFLLFGEVTRTAASTQSHNDLNAMI